MSPVTVQMNIPAGARAGVPATLRPGARRRTENMVMLRSATPGLQLVTLRHSVPLRLGALSAGDLTSPEATPKVEAAERVLETTAGKGGDAR